jgi:hypothetical protein
MNTNASVAQIEATANAVSKYGEYGFGIVSVCVLVTVLAVVWKKIFEPTFSIQLEIAKNNAQITANLSATASTLERTLNETKGMSEQQENIVTRLERLEQKKGG